MADLFSDLGTGGNASCVATSFKDIKPGAAFPSLDVVKRNAGYKYNHHLFSGAYAKNKFLIFSIDSVDQPLNYKPLPLNYFKLLVNKLDSLIWGNGCQIKTGDIARDKAVQSLVDKTGWVSSMRKAVKFAEIYGDSVIKTSSVGASVLAPTAAYKVVSEHDVADVVGVVFMEPLYSQSGTINNPKYEANHIRILICTKGWEFERVYAYKDGYLGNPCRWKYRGRWIKKGGNHYKTDLGINTAQYISCNTDERLAYGESSFKSIAPLIFAIEERLTVENFVVDAHSKPLLLIGMEMVTTDELSGQYKIKSMYDKYLISSGATTEPKYITWDGKLEASQEIRQALMSCVYELSEMSKSFMSGDYSGLGNLSEESLNNLIKGSIDRATRELMDFIPIMKNSLCVLCNLNDIKIDVDEISLNFLVGRVDDDATVVGIVKDLVNNKILSRESARAKYYGYSPEDSEVEEQKILKEANQNDFIG